MFSAKAFEGTSAGRLWIVGGFDGSSSTDAALWFSRDGSAWELVRNPTLAGEGDQEIDAIAGSPAGASLLGGDATSPRLTDRDAAVWTATTANR